MSILRGPCSDYSDRYQVRHHYRVACASELGGLPLGHVLGSGGREELGGELGGFGHVSLDLHLALHECHLGVQFPEADLIEIGISHGESGIGSCGLALLDGALAVLKIDLIDDLDLATLGLGDFEGIDSVNLGNKVLSVALRKVSEHHAENIVSSEAISGV
jgi:hypothetical protein